MKILTRSALCLLLSTGLAYAGDPPPKSTPAPAKSTTKAEKKPPQSDGGKPAHWDRPSPGGR